MWSRRVLIDVSGELELDDGRGGVLLCTVPLFEKGLTASFIFPPTEVEGGLYECSFAGDRLLLHSSIQGGQRYSSIVH
eukprot:COSAG01_NODE_15843_length_1293_cov_1.927973_2_plen_78_part_00